MTVSDFENFKTNFFEQLSKGNKKCLKIIDDNSKLVEYYILFFYIFLFVFFFVYLFFF